MSDSVYGPSMSDDEETVLLAVHDSVAVITLNRPERRNAWTPELEQRFYERLRTAQQDPAVRAAVLTGAGGSFCPGVDTERLDRIAGRPLDLRGRISPATTLAFRKPLIAAINGACAGLGLVQALMCDVRLAARGARFATSFARRGLAGEYGITWLLPRLIGPERALDLLLSGRTFDADEALALGVVSRVVDTDVVAAALAYARDLATHCSPTSMALIKHQVNTDLDTPYGEAMQRSYAAMAAMATGPDFREGVDSFLQKRTPDFAALDPTFEPAAVTGVVSATSSAAPVSRATPPAPRRRRPAD